MSPEIRTAPRRNNSARLRGAGAGGDAAAGRMVVRFVGRSTQLEQFIGALTEDPRSAARIVGVSGAPGAGKSRFVEEAIGRLTRAGRPVALVQPAITPGLDGAAWLHAFAVKLPIGGAMLSGAVSRFVQEAGARLDDSSARALVNALFHEGYDSGVERRGFIRPKPQLLAIVLDDFDLLSAEIVRWLAECFLPRLDEVRTHLDYVLVLVGERSLASSLEPVAWNALPMRFLSIEIPPMSEAESVELLAAFARRATEAKTCHEIGEGLPGAMIELLRHRPAQLQEMRTTIGRCTGMQAEALVAIAGLGCATGEGLRLVLGEQGVVGAGSLLDAGASVPVFGSLRSGGLWLPGAIARMVHEQLDGRNAELARRAAETGQMIEDLAEHFPTEADRELAARLAVLRHFTPAALAGCFGVEEGERLTRFVRAHGSGYERTEAENFRLTDGLRSAVERYAGQSDDDSRAAVREKAARLWSERSAEIGAESQRASANLKAMEKDRAELLKELEKARGLVAHSESENQKEWRLRIDEGVVRVGASLAANAMGVACFWAALFAASQRLTFLVLGGILIGIGIGMPALNRGRRGPRPEDAVIAVRRRQQERVGQARGTVSMIEARINGLQQRLATERRKVEKLRAAAEEPYV